MLAGFGVSFGLPEVHHALRFPLLKIACRVQLQSETIGRDSQLDNPQRTGRYHYNMATPNELYDLIENDDWTGVEGLLDQGLDLNAPFGIDNEYLPCTPLQQASGLGALKVIEGLIDRGADLNHSKTYGTPLYCAVSFDRYEASKLLLSKGASPNARGPSQVEGDGRWTPLICAVFRKQVPIVKTYCWVEELILAWSAAGGLVLSPAPPITKTSNWSNRSSKWGHPSPAMPCSAPWKGRMRNSSRCS